MITTEKKIQVLDFVENFKQEFKNQFGVNVTVIYNLSVDKVDIEFLEKITNEVLKINCPGDYAEGIRSRRRHQALSEHRQIFYKLAREMGYNYSYLAKYIGFDHSTAVYSVRKVESLMKLKDKITIDLYQTIKTKLYDQIDVQNIGGQSTEPKSDLSAL